MDAAALRSKIYGGYAKAATRIGQSYIHYRPTAALTPLSTALPSIFASFNAEDFTYGRPNKYGKPTWFGVFDGGLTAVGDYLVGPEGTFFIAAQQIHLPILCVECNRTIKIMRPQQQTGVGAVGYGGDIAANETVLMSGWPASVLQGTKGEKGDSVLPGDTRNPWWSILLPSFAGVTIRSRDVITDDLNRRYVVSSAELTDLGYRLTAMQELT